MKFDRLRWEISAISIFFIHLQPYRITTTDHHIAYIWKAWCARAGQILETIVTCSDRSTGESVKSDSLLKVENKRIRSLLDSNVFFSYPYTASYHRRRAVIQQRCSLHHFASISVDYTGDSSTLSRRKRSGCSGICANVNIYTCSGHWLCGACPGAANIQCCV